MDINERMYWVALQTSVSGKASYIAGQILAIYGSLETFWKAKDRAELPGVSEEIRQRLIRSREIVEPARLWEICESKKVGVICSHEDGFPEGLRRIDDCPAVLFYYGDFSLTRGRAAAIVGSRRCTAYGRMMAGVFAKAFAQAGLTVVSGMAKGIDAAAHESAADEPGGTIAVLGCGVDIVYPTVNKDLYRRIAERGLILSEFFPGEKPAPWRFPLRNRIISALSDFALLVECEARSGALITCDWAIEQGKDVWAIPGPLTNQFSIGPLRLIQEGAMMALSPQGVLGYYQANAGQANAGQDRTDQVSVYQDSVDQAIEDADEGDRVGQSNECVKSVESPLSTRASKPVSNPASRQASNAHARGSDGGLFSIPATAGKPSLSPSEKKLLELISYYPSHINYLIALYKSDSSGQGEQSEGKTIGKLYLDLTNLISSHLIEKLPGDYYQRL